MAPNNHWEGVSAEASALFDVWATQQPEDIEILAFSLYGTNLTARVQRSGAKQSQQVSYDDGQWRWMHEANPINPSLETHGSYRNRPTDRIRQVVLGIHAGNKLPKDFEWEGIVDGYECRILSAGKKLGLMRIQIKYNGKWISSGRLFQAVKR